MSSFRIHHRQSGFTLVELMIAAGIAGILAAIAIPQYNQHLVRSSLTGATGTLKELRSRMEQRYADNRTYGDGSGSCAVPNFVHSESRFSFACVLANNGQSYTWTATGTAVAAGFVYSIDEAGMEVTVNAPSGWTTTSLPANRFIVRRGS